MNNNSKSKASRRLKVIEGQVRGLQKMIEDDRYCIDIITQTSAVKKALSSVEDLILEGHLRTHVIDQIKDKHEDLATKEILRIYKLKQGK